LPCRKHRRAPISTDIRILPPMRATATWRRDKPTNGLFGDRPAAVSGLLKYVES
jgi:hypothetical protein